MKQWIKIERIPGFLASAYIKATRLVIDSYYRPVAEEIVLNMNKGPMYLRHPVAKIFLKTP